MVLSLSFLLAGGCVLIPDSEPQSGAPRTSKTVAPTDAPNQTELMETAQALATQVSYVDPVATAIAFATAQAKANEQMLSSNAQITSTPQETPTPTQARVGPNNSEIPIDIPIPEDDLENLHSSPIFLSFTTSRNIQFLTQFYLTEMSTFDWKFNDIGTYIAETDAQLNYQKPGKKATISMQTNPITGLVTVVISIQKR